MLDAENIVHKDFFGILNFQIENRLATRKIPNILTFPNNLVGNDACLQSLT